MIISYVRTYVRTYVRAYVGTAVGTDYVRITLSNVRRDVVTYEIWRQQDISPLTTSCGTWASFAGAVKNALASAKEVLGIH